MPNISTASSTLPLPPPTPPTSIYPYIILYKISLTMWSVQITPHTGFAYIRRYCVQHTHIMHMSTHILVKNSSDFIRDFHCVYFKLNVLEDGVAVWVGGACISDVISCVCVCGAFRHLPTIRFVK